MRDQAALIHECMCANQFEIMITGSPGHVLSLGFYFLLQLILLTTVGVRAIRNETLKYCCRHIALPAPGVDTLADAQWPKIESVRSPSKIDRRSSHDSERTQILGSSLTYIHLS